MKKTVTLLLTTLLILSLGLSLVACSGNKNDGDPNCNHSYALTEQKATCTSGGYATYTCTICKNSYREYENALGHTTSSGTCSRCNQTFEANVWKSSFYVDEFNNPTNEPYITNIYKFSGVFSNSATTNSNLYAGILIDSDDISIKLWEYGSLEVNAYTTTYYNITFLDDDGNKHYTTGTMYKNGERIRLKDFTFASLLQQNQKLKVYIESNSKYGYKSTYLFEVENGNFNTVYSNFFD